MQFPLIRKHYFLVALIGICGFYFCFELFFNAYSIFSVDDFWFTHAIYKYKNGLPYRDFAPYKTVLGYYLLLLPLSFSHGVITTLIFLKNIIASINTLVFFFSALWLTRFFSKQAILCSLLILTTAELVLSYSTNIRVDLIAYWFCLFSLLLILDKRFLSAGVLLGLGFLTSQKVIWCIFASDCALFFSWLIITRNKKIIMDTVKLNLALIVTVILYLLFWSLFADWKTIINNVFYEASAMYSLDLYASARLLFWRDITNYNPLLFFLLPLNLISLFVTYVGEKNYERRLFITLYANTIFFCLIFYKQVFPYYMQVLFPGLLLLNAVFFDWFSNILKQQQNLKILIIGQKGLWLLIVLFVLSMVFLKMKLGWPPAYFLICCIPLFIGLVSTINKSFNSIITSLFSRLTLITLLFIGLIYPFMLYSMRLVCIDGAYQKANLRVVNALLATGGDYMAGVDLIYTKMQAIDGLRHLMLPAIAFLEAPNEKLRKVMLPSLDENPRVSLSSVMSAFKQSNVKFYVNNYRIMALPEILKIYLHSQYEHYWGSVYLYAPQINAGRQNIFLKFSGKYQIQAVNKVIIANKEYKPHDVIYLKKGNYISNSKQIYRLKLTPELSVKLDAKFQEDAWTLLVF